MLTVNPFIRHGRWGFLRTVVHQAILAGKADIGVHSGKFANHRLTVCRPANIAAARRCADC